MPRRTPPKPPRTRRTAEDAQSAILDAAEAMLHAAGPSGIRLQEVARSAGLSHPTVLHHFGSREGLIEAVVARAVDSLHKGLFAAVAASSGGFDTVAELLDRVFETLFDGGHARAVLWLALEGYEGTMEQLNVRPLAVAVHELRCSLHKARDLESGKSRPLPSPEDTYFSVLLPALALLSLAVLQPKVKRGGDDEEGGSRRFRTWLAARVHEHLEA